ncbi:MAG: GNAT family N-acetyltransferase [Planctomycetes bacterium]|nr:GNAT family N-acetyltransferase [Planctomycetota bacterium]
MTLRDVTGPVELVGERLILREVREDDWGAVHRYASDPEVCRFMAWGPNTVEETKAHVQRSLRASKDRPRLSFTLALTLREGGDVIGCCSLVVSSAEHREGHIGYSLIQQYWGQGYATEAGRLLVKFGFQRLGLHRIFATCDPENRASARVLEKAGMQLEGRMRSHRFVKGRWRDSLLYAILEEESSI